MNPLNNTCSKDAVFLSPHKFVGGPVTPGVMIVKKKVIKNSVPASPGGGTVLYVTPVDHQFIADHERREEGGTPAIVESVRAGLVFKLQQAVGTDLIESLEASFKERALAQWKLNKNIEVLTKFSDWIKEKIKSSKDDVSAACNDYLRVLGLLAVGYSWLKVLDISYKEIKNNKNFFEDKIETAKFFFDRILPRIDTHYKSGISGSKNIMNFKFN
jgi:hypothetical protein